MTLINTIHQRFEKHPAYKSLLILSIVSVQHFGVIAKAQPVIYSYAQFTDRFEPNSIPGFPVGDKVQIATVLDSSDPVGSPMISVKAVQDGTTLVLEFDSSTTQIYPGLHIYSKVLDFDVGLLGTWECTPMDSTGIGPSIFTPAIAEPEFVPFLEDVTVAGTSADASVSWDLPSLNGFDVDRVYVRVVEVTSGKQIFQSNALPVQQTSYQVPSGVFAPGVDYAFRIMLTDVEGGFNENRSNSLSEPFRLTVAGDYNQNGIVDAADYTLWRDNIGGGALINRGAGIAGPIGDADYDVWKANFGQTLGSAASATANVPEPATVVLLFLAAGMCVKRHRTREFVS